MHEIRKQFFLTAWNSCCQFSGLQVSIVGLERALYAYVKDSSHTAPFDLKTVPLATTPMQEQVVKPGKAGEVIYLNPLKGLCCWSFW